MPMYKCKIPLTFKEWLQKRFWFMIMLTLCYRMGKGIILKGQGTLPKCKAKLSY
jgi:hypothetical protein